MNRWLVRVSILPVVAALGLAQTPPAGTKPSPTLRPVRSWVESVALAFGLASEKTEWVVDEQRRRQALEALLRDGLNPEACGTAESLPLTGGTFGGLSAFEWCAAYNNPGRVPQTMLEWNRPLLFRVGLVAVVVLITLGPLIWALRMRRAILAVEYWRRPPGPPPEPPPPRRVAPRKP